MTNQHPTTPSRELVQQWCSLPLSEEELLVIAAQWGSDQELKACVEWVQGYAECGDSLRAARRPKPPSLKEAALKALAWVDKNLKANFFGHCDAVFTIRCALEALPDD